MRELGFGLNEGAWVPPDEFVWSDAVVFAIAAGVVALVTLLIVTITLPRPPPSTK